MSPGTVSIQQSLELAIQHHQAGRLAEAEPLYRQILAWEPEHPDALHLLGIIAHQAGQHATAEQLIGRAIAAKPDEPRFRFSLANTLIARRQFDSAIDSLRQALRLQPDYVAAHNNLGLCLKETNHFQEAITAFQTALQIKPDFVAAHSNLGNTLKAIGDLDAAIAAYRAALHIQPDLVEVHSNLGVALQARGFSDEAIGAYETALGLRPQYAEAHNNLGLVFLAQGSFDKAVSAFENALRLKPDYGDAWNNLGNALRVQELFDAASAAYHRALRLRPDSAEVQSNLGAVLKDTGQIDQAIECFRRAMKLKPHAAAFHSNLIYALYFHSASDSRGVGEELTRWDLQHASAYRSSPPAHGNDPDASRRLRVGYVSSDFRDHVVGQNVLPLLRNHDHSRFEITCYSGADGCDSLSEQFRAVADQWRSTVGLSDEQLAGQIRADRIDILVDLTLHMAGNRLLVFARKPAPVQVSFAGYPGCAGVEAIDYHLTDRFLEPIGPGEIAGTAEAIRLPDSFWCYNPMGSLVPVNTLPALRAGCVTFGCLNNFAKVNNRVLGLWARVLQKVGGARLLILASPGSHRERTLEVLKCAGVESHRVGFLGKLPREQYLELYHRLDLVLDTFPYNGHTTSLDGLWMGVPMVSLVGQLPVSRGGLSLLSNIGLPEFAVASEEDYIRIAAEWAGDLPRLAHLRSTLRARLQASPLMDARRFTRNIEIAYSKMWERWCALQREAAR